MHSLYNKKAAHFKKKRTYSNKVLIVLNNQYASKFENLFLACIDGDSSKGYKLRKLQTTKLSKPKKCILSLS